MAAAKAKAAGKKAKSNLPSTPATLAKLQVLGKEKTDEYLHARNTTIKYQQQANNAQKWLASFFAEEKAAEREGLVAGLVQPGKGESLAGLEKTESASLFRDPEFQRALDGPPGQYTPTAISMYLVYKCFEQDLKNSTAVQIHAALIREYDQMDADTYRGRWRYDESRRMWVGNPVRSAKVEDVMLSIKHKDGIDGGDRKHSLAMSKKCIEQLYAWSSALCPPQTWSHLPEDLVVVERQAIHLRFRARASLGFTLWTRNCETTRLQYQHFEFNDARRKGGSPLDPPHFEVNLTNRKNWQRKQDKNQSVCGHNYKIYPQPKTPTTDMYTHLLDWFDFYELLLGRALQPEDYAFPFIGTDCKVHPHRAMSSDLVQKELNEFAMLAGVRGAGSFTTHCYRRGGAQYRFMFAPIGERWTLARIRWWGGWAEKEHRDTLIRYLLDELYNYEEDHSDALCPISREAEHSLMGEAALQRPASVAELGEFLTRIKEENPVLIQQAVASSLAAVIPLFAAPPTTPAPQMVSAPVQSLAGRCGMAIQTLPFAPTCASSASQLPTPRRDALVSHPLNLHFPTVPLASPQVTSYQPLPPPAPTRTNPAWIIPAVSGKEAWRKIIQDWETADASRSLSIPLRDWTTEQIKQGGASIYKQRALIATEFIDTYDRDEAKFIAAYPEHTQGVVRLLHAIRIARAVRGQCKQRRSKNGTPDERARRFGSA
ncbi:hypothetical protein GLOTRDRAFT_128893 [Gloeophyllum trabeum ATCC 11539]|uniref:Uncharacterized protein n=1 Tax=Gloeophyllum trabeum (strain ATCC 11539 / FP-39264 / Madison 617) TaxID=670483 RepID=S7RMK7_GLOTA|nr:uncharacterized protein GLOTRDRAFT_128893 [Gloeophyllum trabeum ATCC 11539]EPQ55680.1 hypothetical protein GLOTRDRAFT_128893 [Gloeophyllum trabeum ATCC 11539]